MARGRCDHVWQQQETSISGRATPVARWVCARCGDATDTDPVPTPGMPPRAPGEVRTFTGSGSWSFRTGSTETLDAALWLRDTFTLPVTASPIVPPPLADPPPRRPWPDDDVDASAAARAWTTWWARLISATTDPDRSRAVTPDDVRAVAAVGEVFAALWDDAHAAVRGTPLEARRRREEFPHALLMRVVDDVAFDLGVDPGDLHGSVTVLAVAGPWWHLVAPGRALASADLTADPPTTHALLDAVLRSAASPPRQ